MYQLLCWLARLLLARHDVFHMKTAGSVRRGVLKPAVAQPRERAVPSEVAGSRRAACWHGASNARCASAVMHQQIRLNDAVAAGLLQKDKTRALCTLGASVAVSKILRPAQCACRYKLSNSSEIAASRIGANCEREQTVRLCTTSVMRDTHVRPDSQTTARHSRPQQAQNLPDLQMSHLPSCTCTEPQAC